MKNGDWIDQLREREQHYEAPQLPEGLLDDIMARVPSSEPRPAIAPRLRLVAVAAAAAVAIVIGIAALVRTQGGAEMPTGNQLASPAPTASASPARTESASPAANKGNEAAKGSPAPVAKKAAPAALIAQAALPQAPIETAAQEAPANQNNGTAEQRNNEITKTRNNEITRQRNNEITRQRNNETTRQRNNETTRQRNNALPTTFSLYASGFGSTADGGDASTSFSSLAFASPAGGDSEWGVSQSSSEKQPKAQSHEAQHDIPMRFGLSVAVPLNGRLSIESGIVYTRLRSDISLSTSTGYGSYEQTLHYIGIPLRASYALWQRKGFRAYAKAGVMAEKLVGSGIAEEQFTFGSSSLVEKPAESRLQFSVGAAIGAEISIAKPLSLFVEPGVSHYFDNGSSIISVYKDRPTTFDLSLGLRLAF